MCTHHHNRLYRKEYEIQQFELDHGIQNRWQPDREEFTEAFKLINIGKQQDLKQQMLDLCKERVFYLGLIKHHAGIVIQRHNQRAAIIMFLCISRWSEASIQNKQVNPVMHAENKKAAQRISRTADE